MKGAAYITVIPTGVGGSLSPYVAGCVRVFREMKLDYQVNCTGTNVQGELDALLAAVKRCHETLHESGAPRVHSEIQLNTRTDRESSPADTVRRVEEKL